MRTTIGLVVIGLACSGSVSANAIAADGPCATALAALEAKRSAAHERCLAKCASAKVRATDTSVDCDAPFAGPASKCLRDVDERMNALAAVACEEPSADEAAQSADDSPDDGTGTEEYLYTE